MSSTSDRPMGDLFPELPSILGRESECAQIERLLAFSRVVTVTGTAGVGKSRTALQVAEQVWQRFPDGVWLIPLSPVSDGAVIPNTVAMELKVRDQTSRPAIDLLIDHLADRSCLLILDACEHVVDHCALMVTALVQMCPGVQVLAVSRQPLGIDAETVTELEPLPVPAAGLEDRVGDLTRCASVELFAERARLAEPGFTVTEANAHAVAEVCRRLDGLPLALELAAAQLRDRSVEELADGTDLHARPPVPPPLRALAPHGSLWTTIGRSHDLCAPAEKLLWARASVFAGDFTLAGAKEICAGGPLDDVERTLAGLVARSVVSRRGERFRMLDSLREYGAWWLRELGEHRAIRLRHRDRYLDMARRAFPQWTGEGQLVWYHWLAGEYPEVRRALETCLYEPDSTALELSGALWFLWFSCDFEREGRDILERALAHDQRSGPLRVRAAWALGLVMIFQDDLDGIERCIQECRSAAPDPTAMKAGDYLEGTDWAMSGRPEPALERLVHLVSGAWEEGVQEAVGLLARAALVFALLAMGDYTGAGELAEKIKTDGARRGEHKFRCWGLYIQALIALSQHEHTVAAQHAREAFHGFELLDDSSNMALCLEALAIATCAEGDPPTAARLLGISQRLWHPNGGRARFTTPEVASARQDCDRRISAVIGQEAARKQFSDGLHAMPPYL
ncbi:regulator [Nonomuraea sp. MG754425]|uniref:ATP-binding protein n=1 Tax=Nonomuraea sp. MG754425 TaxID=2570319 RepID=UPI001F3EFE2C|nr:hypothetical protein [Nonomuraea sp. MG754425]MCF6470700.1 regulator [Nonomuraea sp. MG754425]